VELLAYVKAYGLGGRAKAMTALAAAKSWNIPTKDVQAMLDAAHSDSAMTTVDGDWMMSGWEKHQATDGTAWERQRRHRAEKSRLSPLRRDDRDVTRDTRDRKRNPSLSLSVVGVGVEVPSPKEPLGENPRARRWRYCPAEWTPTPGHLALATELHVNIADEEAKFRDHEFDKPKSDPDRVFSNWIRTASKYSTNGNGNGGRPKKKRIVAADGTILTA
jgi:hypothetical protein